MSRPGERSFRQKTKEEKEKKLGQIVCTFVINHIRKVMNNGLHLHKNRMKCCLWINRIESDQIGSDSD